MNGDLRVRNLPVSNNLRDADLVVDAEGVVKVKLTDKTASMKGYINQDFIAGTVDRIKYKVNAPWIMIENSGNDFNTADSFFTAPRTGLYRVVMNVSVSRVETDNPTRNYVYGIADNDAEGNPWVMRFSVEKNNVDRIGISTSGTSFTFEGVVQLQQGKRYFFAITSNQKLIARPNDQITGEGLGSYFSIELINQ